MQPQYAPQQYPAQQPPMPQFPQQPAYPVQQPYAQPQAPAYPVQPAYPPQGYPQQYPPQQPAAPLPSGSLDSFYKQPASSGGPSFKFMDANRQPQIGKYYEGFVARPVTDADVRAQTNDAGQPQTYRDGRPKFVLVVPMRVQPSQEFPEGQAGWWVKGQARDELARAMAEAGAPAGAPEAGAFIRVTLVGTRPIPGKNPAYQYRVEYVRPQGAAQAPVPQPEVQPAAPAPMPQPVMQTAPVVSTASGQPVVHQQPIPAAAVIQAAANNPLPAGNPVAVQQPMAPPQQGPAPTGFSPEQAELFSRLTGSQG